jgi:hypothetical protein
MALLDGSAITVILITLRPKPPCCQAGSSPPYSYLVADEIGRFHPRAAAALRAPKPSKASP